jgi:hypothetical protein
MNGNCAEYNVFLMMVSKKYKLPRVEKAKYYVQSMLSIPGAALALFSSDFERRPELFRVS